MSNFLNSRHLNGQIEDTRYSGVTGTPGDDSYSIARVSSPPPGDQLGVEEEDEDEAPTKPAFAEDNDGQGFQSDVREVHPADPTRPTFREMMRSIFWNPFTFLLPCLPVALYFHFSHPDESILIFVLSSLAIIPLAKLLAFATDELSAYVGQALAGLINATLGNAVELIIAIMALLKCELRIVQSSLIGSMLSNLLLVLGMCFFAGGIKYSEQGFAKSATQMNVTLVVLSVVALFFPTVFDMALKNTQNTETEQRSILLISRGTAVLLLFVYILYLYFQLFSHERLYKDDDDASEEDMPRTVPYPARTGPSKGRRMRNTLWQRLAARGDLEKAAPVQGSEEAQNLIPPVLEDNERGPTIQNNEEPHELTLWVSIIVLLVVTAMVGVAAEALVDSIDGFADTAGISKEFIGLILLPIVGNAAEHVTAVTSSVKDKIMLSISVAVGSSIQIALFVIPFSVLVGWASGHPLSMFFDAFELFVLFCSVLTVGYVVSDGRSNWLEGVILMVLYIIAAVAFYVYPGSQLSGLLTC